MEEMDFDKKSFFCKKKIPTSKVNSYNILSNICTQFSTMMYDMNVPISKKVDGLCNLWLRLLSFVRERSQDLCDYIDLICHWSLHIVLNDEWENLESFPKMCLLSSLKLCKLEISKSMTGPRYCIQNLDLLIKIFLKPWSIEFLDKIFNTHEVKTQEVFDYLKEECNIVFERIKMLSQFQCEDLALKLVEHCYVSASGKQAELLQELRLILLYKLNNMEQIVKEFKHLSTQRSIALLQSFIDYSKLSDLCPQSTNLYNCLESVLKDSLDILMKQVSLYNNTHFYQVCDLWMNHALQKIDDQNTITSMLSSVTNIFASSEQLYYLFQKLNDGMITTNEIFCIRMLMKALTVNINEFENTEEKNEKKKSAHRLAEGFLQLASLLKCSNILVRECMLSSFSLYPTDTLLVKIIEELNVTKHCSTSTIWSDGAMIGLNPQECDDLIILFEVHRNSSLSWTLEKQDLENNCLSHMSNYEKIFEQIPLNHLHVDYSQFDNIPRSEPGMFDGIEKGYEIFLEAFTPPPVKGAVKAEFIPEDQSAIVDDSELSIQNSAIHPACNVMDSINVPTETNQPNDRESIYNAPSSTHSDIHKTKTIDPSLSKALCEDQKPLVPKINVENTLQCQNNSLKARRKSNRKKKSKENKAEPELKTLVTPQSQISIGLKRVMYPQKKKNNSEIEKQETIIKDKYNNVPIKSISGEPPEKSARLDKKVEDLRVNFIDLSSHETVSKLVSSASIIAHEHILSNSFLEDNIQSVFPSPRVSEPSPTVPIDCENQNLVHFFDRGLYLKEHSYFATKPDIDDDRGYDSDEYVEVVQLGEDDVCNSDVDVEFVDKNYSSLHSTEAELLSQNNRRTYSSICDEDFEHIYFLSMSRNSATMMNKKPVDLQLLTNCTRTG